MDNKEWIAMFSQSGEEIATLAKRIGRNPYIILTNNRDIESYSPAMSQLMDDVPYIWGSHKQLMSVLRDMKSKHEVFITLHGYLRIIPLDICEKYSIFNGHPGLITLYPELKGKDPQEMVLNNPKRYDRIGSVVHRCTYELDGGEILTVSESVLQHQDENIVSIRDIVYNTLREHSLNTWETFFKTYKGTIE